MKDRNDLLRCYYPGLIEEHKKLRSEGLGCSQAYHLLALSYGFKSWISLLTDLQQKAY